MRRGFIVFFLFFVAGFGAAADTPTVQSVVEAFRERYAALDDYQCRMYEFCRKGSAFEERTMDLYFKKPRLIRMDVVKGNRSSDNGAVGVFRNNGNVTVRPGGLLSFLSVTVDKHDPRIASIRGHAIDEIDLQAVRDLIQSREADGVLTVSVADGEYLLSSRPRDPSKNGGVTRELIRLAAVKYLPISSDSFEGDTLVQHVEWSRFVLDAGLPDELFDVHWDVRELALRSIPSVSSVPPR